MLRNLHLTFVYMYCKKRKVEISQNFVAFSEYTNFNKRENTPLFLEHFDTLDIGQNQ